MQFNGKAGTAAVLLWLAARPPVAAQTSTREFWPELDIFVQYNDRLRFVFQDALTLVPESHSNQGRFTGYLEVALRPLIRVELRHRNDVFRQRFLTLRTGYRYTTPLSSGDASGESRAIVELNARYPVPGKLVIADRNRGEFRFVRGKGFSMRYRNRLGIERDFAIGSVRVTPYLYDEYFYDTRYGSLARVRYTFGLLFPAGRHVVVEPYLARQVNKQSNPRQTGVLGLNLNLYF